MEYKKLREELVASMKSKNETRTLVIRGLITGLTNELIAKGRKPNDEPTEDDILTVIKRQAKQREDSITQFKAGGRNDLVQKEEAELAILKEYLPAQMGREDIEKIARAKKEEMGAIDKSKLGILIGAVMKQLKNQADGSEVKSVVESLFE